VELRSYLSEPELPGSGQGTDQVDPSYLTLQRRGLYRFLIIQVISKTHYVKRPFNQCQCTWK